MPDLFECYYFRFACSNVRHKSCTAIHEYPKAPVFEPSASSSVYRTRASNHINGPAEKPKINATQPKAP